MATFKTNKIDEIILDFQNLYGNVGDMLEEMVQAQAEVVEEETRREAKKLGIGYDAKNNNARQTSERNTLPGQKRSYATGATAESVAVSKPKKTQNGRSVRVYFRGKRPDGKSATEVAFLNEFGTRNINARGFVQKANKKSEDAAFRAAQEAHDNYLKKKGF